MQTSTATFETQTSPMTTGLEANIATSLEVEPRHGNFLSRTLNAAHSAFTNAVEFVGDRMPSAPHNKWTAGLAAGAIAMGGATANEAVSPSESHAAKSGIENNMVVADTTSGQRVAISRLKREWRAECKDYKKGFHMALVGPSISQVETQTSYKVATLSCAPIKPKTFVGVRAPGNGMKYYAKWKQSFSKGRMYTRPISLSFSGGILELPDDMLRGGKSGVDLEARRGFRKIYFNDGAQIPFNYESLKQAAQLKRAQQE